MAARFFVNGGVNNLWSNTGNWSLTSGGSGGQTVPGAADDVTLDSNSPNCIMDLPTVKAAKSIDATSYTNQLTMNTQVTVAGNVILGAGMKNPILGDSRFVMSVDSSFTSNNIMIPGLSWTSTTHTPSWA